MFARTLAVLISAWLSISALMVPFSAAHRVNVIVAGTLAALFSFFALASDRARVAAAVVGGWMALSPFVLRSTLLEEVILVSWGVAMFALMAGPFSQRPRIERTPPAPADSQPSVALAA